MKERNLNPLLLSDFYKQSHRVQYPIGTQFVYSTWTPRGSRMENVNEVILFGLQGFAKKYLVDYFNDNFFNKPLDEVIASFERMLGNTLGGAIDSTHVKALHELGYLPIEMKALKEGSKVPTRVPCITIVNTLPEFYWVTNFLETLMSCELWQPITSSTIALEYRKILEAYALATVGNLNHVPFQAHDFSMRGMSSVESAMTSGAGHLLSFVGTDTIPAIHYLEQYYNADITKELVGTSIPATEHSVMCSYGDTNELELFKHLVTEVYPSGIFSAVSDTWDLWKVCTEYLPTLKKEILDRDGKLVIRPDSGDPTKIICGDDSYPEGTPQNKGVIQLLWETFGGTTNALGFKELDSHIGAIYGDSITLQRARDILEGLKNKGFASSNIVFGVGSFTYQYNTRDTFAQAMKATYCVVNGEERLLFKDPVTDNGTKKSQRGMVVVTKTNGTIGFVDGLNKETIKAYEGQDLLEVMFRDGKMVRDESLADIRTKIRE